MSKELFDKRFQRIIESTSDFFGVAKEDGQMLYINRSGRMITGIGLDQDITKIKMYEFFSQEHLKQFESIVNKSNQSNEAIKEIITVKNLLTNEEFQMDISFFMEESPNSDDKLYMAFAKDLRQTQQNQDLLETIENSLQVGGWELDLTTNTPLWSNAVYDIHKLPRGSEVDLSKAIHFYAEHEREKVSEMIEKCIRMKKSFDREYEFYNSAKEKMWIRTIGKPMINSQGEVYKIRGVFQDITDQKILRDQVELEKLKTLQASKLASLGEMSAGIAHEINNPLAIIHGNAEMLSSPKMTHEKIIKVKSKIQDNVERIKKIVDGLKKFSRKTTEVDFDYFSLQGTIDECLAMIIPKAKNNNVEIKISQLDQIDIYCDQIQIQQILINLINNSIDAVKDLELKWVEVYSQKKLDTIQIIVKDSGKGISQANLQKIFDPFYTSKGVGEGTGLGLSLSLGIAKDHNGNLEYQFKGGHTAFVLSLPLKGSQDD